MFLGTDLRSCQRQFISRSNTARIGKYCSIAMRTPFGGNSGAQLMQPFPACRTVRPITKPSAECRTYTQENWSAAQNRQNPDCLFLQVALRHPLFPIKYADNQIDDADHPCQNRIAKTIIVGFMIDPFAELPPVDFAGAVIEVHG